MKSIPKLLGLALALFLAGCSAQDLRQINPWADKSPSALCPQVKVLADAATVTKFRSGPGRSLTDVIYSGRITDVTKSCRYGVDDNARQGTLDVEITTLLQISRGPTSNRKQAPAWYFVALADANKRVIQKRVFEVRAKFEGNRSKTLLMDGPVEMKIPLPTGKTSRDFLIFVGFQLSKSELQYNRKNRMFLD